jgi:glycosyltransferase involved in cell wall biosynthesis
MPGLLSQLFKMERTSLVHVHISSAYTPEMVWIWSKRRGNPYVAHVHLDVLPSGRAGSLLDPYKKLFLGRVLRDAAAIVVPTEDYRELISTKYDVPDDRVLVVPNGTNHTMATQARTLRTSPGPKELLFVGRLSIQKNIPLLLETLEAYPTWFQDDLRVKIVGEGDLRSALEAEVVRRGLSDIVTMPGALHGAALEAAYENADLFVLTSVSESFGLVLIEAMTKGLPIVSVNIPAVRNVVIDGKNGLLVDANPEALAIAIHGLLNDERLYAAVSSSNLVRARQYDWATITQQVLALYDTL